MQKNSENTFFPNPLQYKNEAGEKQNHHFKALRIQKHRPKAVLNL
jgi:hypothetical protein